MIWLFVALGLLYLIITCALAKIFYKTICREEKMATLIWSMGWPLGLFLVLVFMLSILTIAACAIAGGWLLDLGKKDKKRNGKSS